MSCSAAGGRAGEKARSLFPAQFSMRLIVTLSEGCIRKAKWLHNNADPETLDQLRQGKISIHKAYTTLTDDEPAHPMPGYGLVKAPDDAPLPGLGKGRSEDDPDLWKAEGLCTKVMICSADSPPQIVVTDEFQIGGADELWAGNPSLRR